MDKGSNQRVDLKAESLQDEHCENTLDTVEDSSRPMNLALLSKVDPRNSKFLSRTSSADGNESGLMSGDF